MIPFRIKLLYKIILTEIFLSFFLIFSQISLASLQLVHFHFDDLSLLCVFFCYSLFDCNCQVAIVAVVVIIFIVIIVDLSMYPTNVCLSVSMSVCLSFFVWLLCKSVSSLSTKTKIIYNIPYCCCCLIFLLYIGFICYYCFCCYW